MQKTRIIFAGEGGQGIQTISKIFLASAVKQGMNITYIPSFGVEQRGTPSVSFITIDGKEIRHPKFDKADIAVVLGGRAIGTIERYLDAGTTIYFDSSTISHKEFPLFASKLLGAPATKYAQDKFTLRSSNLIVLGLITNLFEIKEELVWEEIKTLLGRKFKKKEDEDIAKEAFLFGRLLVPEKDNFTTAVFKTKHQKIMYKGYGKHGYILPEKCKGCGVCISKCPVGALRLSTDLGVYSTPIPKVDLEKCIGCQNCLQYCPDGAVVISKD